MTLGTEETTLPGRDIVSISCDGFFAIRPINRPLHKAAPNDGGISAQESANRESFGFQIGDEIIQIMSERVASASVKQDFKIGTGTRSQDVALKSFDVVAVGMEASAGPA
jgi:hypothetical protein